MNKQAIIYGFCFIGIALYIGLLPTSGFNRLIAIADMNTDKELLTKPKKKPKLSRPKLMKPGGDRNAVLGGIIIPEKFKLPEDTADPAPLLARFSKQVNIQVEVMDKTGKKDGDGIDRIEISVSKIVDRDTQESVLVYEQHVEKYSPYCFFEGGEPCGSINKFWPNGKLVENGQYSAYIDIYRKKEKDPNKKIQWFFRFEIQRPE